jgi:digeranylgeranylglycerophospholipid reductase
LTSTNGSYDIVRDVDVVVVGAGPGGSLAAREAARGGAKTLFLDRRQEIGAPKRCAEGLSLEGMEAVGVQPHPTWAVGRIQGAVLYPPNNPKVCIVDDPAAVGYVLERKVFEKALAAQAIEAGAQCMVKTFIDGVLKDGDRVTGVTGDFMGKRVRVNAKVVIGADGIDSLVGRKAGLRTMQKMTDFHSAAQYEMAGVNCDMTRLHLFFGSQVAPFGYVWIFPKANGLANVGIGILTTESRPGGRAIDYLDRFIASRPDIFKNASPVEINASGIPVSAGLKKFWGNGILLVGDAAQQVNPIHGGGIALAMRGGAIAGGLAAEAVRAGDTSEAFLSVYHDRWMKAEGHTLQKLYKFRMFMEELSDQDMDRIADIITGDVIVDLTYARFRTFAKLMLTKMPTMLPLLLKYMRAPGQPVEDLEAIQA